jgi:hypothetical protein
MSETERIVNLKDELDEIKGIFHIHIEHFKQHELTEKENYQELLRKVNESCENTKGLVDIWNAATGTIKVITVIGSIIKWLSGIAIAVGSIWFLLHGQIPTSR